jgi:hypothetical protein
VTTTLLLIHSDTTDGSTTFVDSSDSARTISAFGNVHHENTTAKFGATSIQFDGDGDYLTVPSSTDFNFGTGDFTIDFWLRVSVIDNYDVIIGRFDGFFSDGRINIRMHPGIGGIELLLGGAEFFQIPSIALNTWHHISVVRASGNLVMRLNGVTSGNGASTQNINATTPLYIGYNSANAGEAFNGYLDEIRVVSGAVWTADFTPPTAPYDTAGPPITSYLDVPGPLGAPSLINLFDFTSLLKPDSTIYYVMDLITPSGPVRVPISSWQATLQTIQSNYVQCVVPAVTNYVEEIEAATEFVIYRTSKTLSGDDFEYEMARAPLESITFDQGPFRYTATLSGYLTGFAENEEPDAAFNRTLQEIRSISVTTGGVRVRCSIDWLLRPAQRAIADNRNFVVSYINYYVSIEDSFMEVGERV